MKLPEIDFRKDEFVIPTKGGPGSKYFSYLGFRIVNESIELAAGSGTNDNAGNPAMETRVVVTLDGARLIGVIELLTALKQTLRRRNKHKPTI